MFPGFDLLQQLQQTFVQGWRVTFCIRLETLVAKNLTGTFDKKVIAADVVQLLQPLSAARGCILLLLQTAHQQPLQYFVALVGVLYMVQLAALACLVKVFKMLSGQSQRSLAHHMAP